MNPDPSARLSDTGPDLDEFDSQGVDLGIFELCALEMVSHQEKQTIGKDMQVEAKLIRQEPVTAQPIGFEFEFQLLDPVLDISPKYVDLIIDPLGIEAQIRDHKSLIRPLVHVFGLGNHSAGMPPGISPVPESTKEALLFFGLVELLPGFG